MMQMINTTSSLQYYQAPSKWFRSPTRVTGTELKTKTRNWTERGASQPTSSDERSVHPSRVMAVRTLPRCRYSSSRLCPNVSTEPVTCIADPLPLFGAIGSYVARLTFDQPMHHCSSQFLLVRVMYARDCLYSPGSDLFVRLSFRTVCLLCAFCFKDSLIWIGGRTDGVCIISVVSLGWEFHSGFITA